MDIFSIRLEDLGEGALVENDKGNKFIDLSKVDKRILQTGYNGGLEFSFLKVFAKKKAKTGKQLLWLIAPQTEEERKAKAPYRFVGSGVVLTTYNSGISGNGGNDNSDLPSPDIAPVKKAPKVEKGNDLPF